MTDEQAPRFARVRDAYEAYCRGEATLEEVEQVAELVIERYEASKSVPAPEETVETTEERLCSVCGHPEFYPLMAGVRAPCHIDEGGEPDDYCMECERPYSWHTFAPAPEPAGEAGERFMFAVCSRCGAEIPTEAGYWEHQRVHSPAPSSGTPGLTEAPWDEYDTLVKLAASDGDIARQRGEVWAAIAAEARAPLEARIAELERDLTFARMDAAGAWGTVEQIRGETRAAERKLEEVAVERDRLNVRVEDVVARFHDLAMASERTRAQLAAAERQLEKMREAMAEIRRRALNIGGGIDSKRIYELSERALTSPASTAAQPTLKANFDGCPFCGGTDHEGPCSPASTAAEEPTE